MRKISQKIVIIAVVIANVFSMTNYAHATSVSDLQKQLNAANQRAADAQKLANQKAQEKASISAAVNSLQSQINQLQQQINNTNQQIGSAQKQIDDLSAQIQSAENNLKTAQDKMNQLLVAWYMEGDNSGLLNSMLNASTLSSAITKDEYYGAVKQQITDGMDKINALKAQLTQQKNDQNAQLVYLSDLKRGQVAQQQTIQSNKKLQEGLLSNATNALADYNSQKQQATEDISSLTRAIQDAYASYGIGASGIHKGSGGATLNVPYYSQRNTQWSGMSLGDSGYSIGAFGCLITSYAMVASYFGNIKTPADIDNESAFDSQGNFLYFDHDMGALDNYRYRQSVDLNEIDSQLKRGHPVIVGISFSGVPQHWIVLTGGNRANGYSWNDPYPVDASKITSFIAMRTFD